MKEFDKWRENDSRGAGIWTTAAYKKGWRAALEMVLKKEDEVKFVWRAEYKSEENIPTIYDDIREELEE